MQIPLFESAQAPYNLNLLPKDGGAYYYPDIFDQVSSDQLFGKLIQSLDWQPEQIYLFGKKVTTQRKVVWVGDENCLYAYSGMKKHPQPWTLGAKRKFAFKHKLDKSVCSLFLENGSVLIMHSPSQKFWNHSLLKTKTPLPARINLTFRAINPNHELPK